MLGLGVMLAVLLVVLALDLWRYLGFVWAIPFIAASSVFAVGSAFSYC